MLRVTSTYFNVVEVMRSLGDTLGKLMLDSSVRKDEGVIRYFGQPTTIGNDLLIQIWHNLVVWKRVNVFAHALNHRFAKM
jgi:hypothetical protein